MGDQMIARVFVVLGASLLLATASCGQKGTESKSAPPSGVVDLSAGRQTNNTFILTWSIPGDPPEYYSDVRYALLPITDVNWDAAMSVAGVPTISSPVTVTGLSPSTVYYFAVKIRWKNSDWSSISNTATGTTLQQSQKVYGSSEYEGAAAVVQLSGGGYAVVGGSTRYRSGQWYTEPTTQSRVLRLDNQCDPIQQQDFVFGDGDASCAAVETSTGNIAVVGTQMYLYCGAGLYVFMMMPTSVIAGQKVFYSCGYSYGHTTMGHGIVTTEDGGIVVLGEHKEHWNTEINAWLFKMDAQLNRSWEQFYNDTVWDEPSGPSEHHTIGESVARTLDGGYIIAGYVSEIDATPAHQKLWLIRTDENGICLWTYLSDRDDNDAGGSVVAAADGGFVVAGLTHSENPTLSDVYVVKVDGSGYRLWENTFGTALCDEARCIVASPDGGYVIAGSTCRPDSGQVDMYVLKIDDAGDKVWEKTYGGPLDDYASGIAAASGGGYVVVGTTDSYGPVGMSYSNVYVIQISENGELEN